MSSSNFKYGVNGTYKGCFFRSLYELSFLKHLEAQGNDVKDIVYEGVRLQYDFLEKQRTYVVDFYVPNTKTLYEVKRSTDIDNLSENNLAKFVAAKDHCSQRGLQFVVVTERDFKVYKQKDFEHAVDVVFNLGSE